MNIVRFIMLLLCVITLSIKESSSQDTIAPVFTVLPQNVTTNCSASNLNAALTTWYNTNANAVASDNLGQAVISANADLQTVVSSFNASSATLCGENKSVTVSFIATDGSGNTSPPAQATFSTNDLIGPTITTTPTNVQVECNQGTRDSLIRFIKAHGQAMATDGCSSTLKWTTFITNLQPSGVHSIDNGPYPILPPNKCILNINISFFVEDECGNQTATSTIFRIRDTQPPTLDSIPADVTLSCSELALQPKIKAIDACEGEVILNYTETNNRGNDSLSCTYFNYNVVRTFTATDRCGNTLNRQQNIIVKDLGPPIIRLQDTLTIGCSQITLPNARTLLDTLYDDCSDSIRLTFTEISNGGFCDAIVIRVYKARDICGNESEKVQTLFVKDTIDPMVIIPPRDTSFSCEQSVDLQSAFASWISQNRQIGIGSDLCSNVTVFAALPGSYSLSDINTLPGTPPTGLSLGNCPSSLAGFTAFQRIDFLYIDFCQNVTVRTATFGITDSEPPSIGTCPPDVTVDLQTNECTLDYESALPNGEDNCSASGNQVNRSQTRPVVSSAPGSQNVIVDTVRFALGPYGSNSFDISGNLQLTIKLGAIDADDPTEFFHIISEEGIIIGQTVNTPAQCADTTMTITITDQAAIARWLADDIIGLAFAPNNPGADPIFAVNGICTGSRITIDGLLGIEAENVLSSFYTINNGQKTVVATGGRLSTKLEVGSNLITFGVEDCAQNTSTCVQKVFVRDRTAPVLMCLDTIKVNITGDSCTVADVLDFNPTLNENCKLQELYASSEPHGIERFVTFTFDSIAMQYLAEPKTIVFRDMPQIRFANDVTLRFILNGDLNEVGEIWQIRGENNEILGSTSSKDGNGCVTSEREIILPRSVYNLWAIDSNITIRLFPNNAGDVSNGGINPCSALVVGSNTDSLSSISASLRVNDARFTFRLNGQDSVYQMGVNHQIFGELAIGANTAVVTVKDLGGNLGNCIQHIQVRDIQSPKARCRDTVIMPAIDGVSPVYPNASMIDNGSTDNCKITERVILSDSINCSMIGSTFNSRLIVIDSIGNRDTCAARIRVIAPRLQPSFQPVLCAEDTLKLDPGIAQGIDTTLLRFVWKRGQDTIFTVANPTISAPGSNFNGNYTLTITSLNGCIATGNLTVNVMPLSTIALAANSDTVCLGNNAVLQATAIGGNVTYQWFLEDNTPVDTTSSNSLLILVSDTTSSYYVIATNNVCNTTPSELVTIRGIMKPTISVKDTVINVCDGQDIPLEVNMPNNITSYKWNGPGLYVNNTPKPNNLKASDVTAGIYSVVGSQGECRSDTVAVTVQVRPKPGTPTVEGDVLYCKGNTITLSVTNVTDGDLYQWIRNGILVETTNDNTLEILNAQTTSTGLWRAIVIKDDCPSLSSAPLDIVVDELINVGAENNGPICNGDSVTLSATFVPNATYIWEGPNGIVGNEPTLKLPAQAGDYTVTITTATNCTNTATTTLMVNRPPDITALSATNPGCVSPNTIITLIPTIFPQGNYRYRWSGPNGYVDSILNTNITNITPEKQGKYTLIVFSGDCPSQPSSIDVNFNIKPAKPLINGNLIYCFGDTIKLSTAASAQQYIWTTPSGQITTTLGNILIPNANFSNTGTYMVRAANGPCISDQSDTIFVKVENQLQAPGIVVPDKICHKEVLVLRADNMAGDNYEWILPDNSTIAGAVVNIDSATFLNNGLYTLSYNINGCKSPISQAIISVNDSIIPPKFVEEQIVLCQDNNSIVQICLLPNSLAVGGVFELVVNGTITQRNQQGCYNIQPQNQVLGLNQYTARTEVDGCFSEVVDTFRLIRQPIPQDKAIISTSAQVVCKETDVITATTAMTSNNVVVSWSSIVPGLEFSNPNSNGTQIRNFSNGLNGVVLTFGTAECPAFSADTVFFTLPDPPVATDDFGTASFNQTIQLDLFINDILPTSLLLDIITDPTVNGALNYNGSLFTYEPPLGFVGQDVINYRICEADCIDVCSKASVTIDVGLDVECKIPTIFTPNNDGINDFVVVPCIESGRYPNNRLTVFNEWGDQVYGSKPYNNNWDGSYGGDPLPVGTYFMIFDSGDGSTPQRGFIIIQR